MYNEDNKIQNIIDALMTLHKYSRIGGKVESEIAKSELLRAISIISEEYNNVFTILNEDEFKQFKDFNKDLYIQLLDHVTLQVPELTAPLVPDEMNSALMALYRGHVTVHGMLEELLPLMDRWEAAYERSKAIAKALSLKETEWASESMFNIVFPPGLFSKLQDIRETTRRVRIRERAFQTAYDKLSRVMTLYMHDPYEPSRKSPSSNFEGQENLR